MSEGKEKISVKKAFYAVKEVAAMCGLSIATVHRLLDAGELPWTYFGKQRRIPREDFDAYLAAKREDARASQRNRKVVPFHARINSKA